MGTSSEMICKRGDIVFREGDYGNSIYRVLAGRVAVYAKYGTEEENLLAELGEGDYFGEMAVIEITYRSATIVAAEDDTRIAEIDASDLSGYLSEHVGEINSIVRQLSRRLRSLTVHYTEVCDTLRELGRLDTTQDHVNEGLMARIRKFARVYLMGRPTREELAEPHTAPLYCKRELAMHGEAYDELDVVFREGDRSDCMYYIHDGRVGIFTNYGTEKQKLLTQLTPEMFFGEMGIFEGRQRTATAVALEDDTFVELIYEKDLGELFLKNPAMAMMVLQHLSSRLRKLTVDYLKACRTLAETEKEIEATKQVLSSETLMRAEYINQLLLAPEVMF